MQSEANHKDFGLEELGFEVARILYTQGKAQIFNVLESLFENQRDARLVAVKKITENILGHIGGRLNRYIQAELGDWKKEVPLEPGNILLSQDAEDANKKHDENERLFNTIKRFCGTCGNRTVMSSCAVSNPKTLCPNNCNESNGFKDWVLSLGKNK